MEDDKQFLKSVIKTLEEEVERLENELESALAHAAALQIHLDEVEQSNAALGSAINKTLESFLVARIFTDNDSVGEA